MADVQTLKHTLAQKDILPCQGNLIALQGPHDTTYRCAFSKISGLSKALNVDSPGGTDSSFFVGYLVERWAGWAVMHRI